MDGLRGSCHCGWGLDQRHLLVDAVILNGVAWALIGDVNLCRCYYQPLDAMNYNGQLAIRAGRTSAALPSSFLMTGLP